MIRKAICAISCCLCLGEIYSQGLTKNATGESSILFRGHSITLDLGKTDLNLGFNNLQSSMGMPRKFIMGANMQAKNSADVGSLFKSGDLVADGTISGFAGISLSNGLPKSYRVAAKKLVDDGNAFKLTEGSKIAPQIQTIINGSFPAGDLNNKLTKTVDDYVASGDETVLENAIESIANDPANVAQKSKINKLLKQVKSIFKTYKAQLNKVNDEIDNLGTALDQTTYCQFLAFAFGGVNASDFKRFIKYDSTNLGKSFNDQHFRGGNGGIGVNLQCGVMMFGASWDWMTTDNFQLLSSRSYTWTQTITVSNQNLVQQKSITAYSGSYGVVYINNLKIDLATSLKLDKEGTNYVLTNLYLKSQLNSNNTSLLPNSTNVGLGLYFYKQSGSFLGGFYTEVTDVSQNYEKLKPVADQNFQPVFKRISFGVTAKVSIGSLMNLF